MAQPVAQMDFSKKSLIFITGASKGIGQTIAIELSKRVNPASSFVLLARTSEGLEETKNKIAQVDQSIAVLTYQIDLSKPDLTNYNELIDKVLASVDISDVELGWIFHNAGHVGVVLETTQLLDLETWRKYFDLNLFSAVLLNSAFVLKLESLIPQLVVVNITSLVGRVPFSNMSMYGSGKASREIFFKVLAVEKPKLIVLNYSPGPVSTDMFNSICDDAQSAAVREQFQEVRKTNVLTTNQTVEKLLDILKRGTFKSGDTIDYFDRLMSDISPLLFLLKLAWDCRYRLPLLITVGFMVLDVRMQLDINVQMRQIPRGRNHYHPPTHMLPLDPNQADVGEEDRSSDSSWTTFEEQEVTDVSE